MASKEQPDRKGFAALLADVKLRIQTAQTRAVLAANAELIRLYWDIGRMIDTRQKLEGWGAGVIPRLAAELKNELPELKGFSERNIGRMIAFYRNYPDPAAILPQAAAKLESNAALSTQPVDNQRNTILQQPVAKLVQDRFLPQAVAKLGEAETRQVDAAQFDNNPFWNIPWFHHVVLMQKVKDLNARRWYMEQTLANGWSRNVLVMQIDTQAHARHGKERSNFAMTLPAPQSDLVQQTLKDPYIFDFLTLTEPFQERELENELIRQLEKFLLELGQGFAFVGRQVHLEVGGGVGQQHRTGADHHIGAVAGNLGPVPVRAVEPVGAGRPGPGEDLGAGHPRADRQAAHRGRECSHSRIHLSLLLLSHNHRCPLVLVEIAGCAAVGNHPAEVADQPLPRLGRTPEIVF